MNQAQIIGNLTANPDIRETPNGHRVASFSIATNRNYKDNKGEKVQEVEYHNCIAWNKLADIMEKYCTKGKKVFIQGRLQTRTWEDGDGVKRYKTEIIAETLEMLGGGDKNGKSTNLDEEFPGEEYKPEPKKGEKKVPEKEITIEDIPF